VSVFDEIVIPTQQGDVSGLSHVPDDARWLILLAHGAGAGMQHRFMSAVAKRLADRAIATLRYEYPYMTAGSRRPDPAPRLEACTRAVAEFAAREFPNLRVAAGGKSMGGRITSQAQAAAPLARVERLVFLGFPLHAMGKAPNTTRAAHLTSVHIPMLFLQGTRDTLADLGLMREVCDGLGTRTTLHVVDGADHSFAVPRSSGRTHEQALDEIVQTIADWLR
jgi:predicted alpha/beta-hydrolase family hydrolase